MWSKKLSRMFAWSLFLALSLGLLPLTAQAQLLVNGTTRTVTTATTITTSTSGTSGDAIRVFSGGKLTGNNGANWWTLNTNGEQANGIHVYGTSNFTGSNIRITTSSSYANGFYVQGSSTATLVSATITTTGYASYAVEVSMPDIVGQLGAPSVVTLKDLTLKTSGDASHVLYAHYSIVSGTNLNITYSGSNTGEADGLLLSGSSQGSFYNTTVNASGSGFTWGLTGAGVASTNYSTLSCTNLTVTASGRYYNGLDVSSQSILAVTNGTVTVTDASASGLAVHNNGTATITTSTFNTVGDFVTGSDGRNSVTLDRVQSTNGGNVFRAEGRGTNTLAILSSTLNGAIVSNSASFNTVNLQTNTRLTGDLRSNNNSTQNVSFQSGAFLSGSGTHVTTSTLNVSLDAANTQWQVAGNSKVTNLTNSGTVSMHTGGNTLRTMEVNGNFTQNASGMISMSLSGTGGLPNAIVTVDSQTKLNGGLSLLGDLSAIKDITNGYFVLFNDLDALKLVDGTFANITLNGSSLVSLGFSTVADTGGGGSFILDGVTYLFTYTGDATSGALTGGNDVLIALYTPVPEPGTWAMMLGGAGILIYYLRARQHLRRRES